MSRALGITITLVWFASMAALIQRDVLPYWQAQSPPSEQIPEGDYQVGITNTARQRLGTTWVTTIRLKESITVHSVTQLDIRQVASMLPIAGDLFLTTDLIYSPSGELNEFSLVLETSSIQGRVQGWRYNNEFACTATMGSIKQEKRLDAELSRYLGDSLRPFTHLEGLHVGQSWRLRIIDPFSMMQGGGAEFTTKLVKVTAKEAIEHQSKKIDCFRIESDGVVAWADDSGLILRQEVQLPLLGKWIMTDEPFDAEAKRKTYSRRHSMMAERNMDSIAPRGASQRVDEPHQE